MKKAPCQLDTPEDCARVIEANRKLDLKTGILIGIPVPKEHSVSSNVIESAIQTALKEASDKGINGSAETPYLLSRLNELTGGYSLESNIALVKNNAVLGGSALIPRIKAELTECLQNDSFISVYEAVGADCR